MRYNFDCPYLSIVKGNVIRCEFGTFKPPDTESRIEFLTEHCGHAEHYKNCPFYKITDNYYKRKYSTEDVKW